MFWWLVSFLGLDGTLVSFSRNATNEDQAFENLADFAVVHELEAVDIGHAVAEAMGEVDDFGKVGDRVVAWS